MLDVVTTSFYMKAVTFEKKDFAHYSTQLFDEWDSYVESHLELPDYAVTLVIEEGSIKGLGKIAATVSALYIAIGHYGDFIHGVQTIREQASYVTNELFNKAKQRFGCEKTRGNSKQSSGEIYYLKGLFERVQRGDVSPGRAVTELQDRWGEEAASSPDFLSDLAKALTKAPRHPQQLSMSDAFWEPCGESEMLERKPQPRLPRGPELPHPQHYRIEIFRPRKGGDKKVKLTKLK